MKITTEKKILIRKLLAWQIMITMTVHYEEERRNNDLPLKPGREKKIRVRKGAGMTIRSHLFALLITADRQKKMKMIANRNHGTRLVNNYPPL